MTRKLDQTYTRLGRGQQFTSRDERDEWIQKELETIRTQIENKNLQLNELETFSANTKSNLREKETEIESRKEKLNKVKSEQMEAHQTLTQLLQQKAKLCKDHKESCIHLQTLRTEAVVEQERSRSLRTRLASFGGLEQILSGWDSIRHVLKELPELGEKYHGMVIQNIKTEKIMHTVIDEIGGNRLFHHIVDTDQVATTLIREINMRKLPGTFSFMPLNRIQPKSQHKFSETPDAFLLLPKLKYPAKVKVIMTYLFGRVLVCRNMTTVVRLARETGFDCVTPDGERGSSRGVLQGGYINKDNSKMATFPEYHSSMEKLTEIRDRIDIAEGEKESWGMKIEEVFGKIEKMKEILSRNEILIIELNDNLQDEKRMALVERVREEEAQMCAMVKELKLLKEGVRELEGEMSGDMASQLNEEERKHCEGMAKEIEEIKKSFKKKVAEKTDLLKKRFLMQGRMQNLSKEMRVTHEDHRKRTEWERAMEVMELELEHMESRLKEETTELSTLMMKIESIESKIMELMQNLDNDENIVRKYEEELEKIKTKKDTGSNLKARLVLAESDLRKKER